MEAFGERIQTLMDEAYTEWQKEENKGKGKWNILDGLSEAHQIAVVFGNFNYQVENGGISQWIYNGYFHDDAEKLIGYLETGAESDERCRTILDSVYKLDQYAQETDCDRYGSFYDPDNDGENGFIGEMINGDAFDSWYYKHCGNDDWWGTVCGIIDKTEGHDLAPEPDATPPPISHPLRVYIENIVNENIGGFTMPLPATREEFKPFFDGAEITGWRDMTIAEAYSDIKGMDERLTEAIAAAWHPDILSEINYLAARIGDLDETGRDIFCANIEAGRNCGSVAAMINLTFTENLNRFDIQPAFSEEQYGDFQLDTQKDETSGIFRRFDASENPDERAFAKYILRLEEAVDPAALGRTVVKEEDGVFTSAGYLTGGGDLQELYRGPRDIPFEYLVYDELTSELHSLSKYIPADADKSELAYLAERINGMDGEQRRVFDAVTEAGWNCGSVAEIVNLTENLDCFTLQPAFTEAEYGEYRLMKDWDESREALARLEQSNDPSDRALFTCATRLRYWMDEETYGSRALKSSDGVFTEHGFLVMEETPKDKYRGVQDLPREYRSTTATDTDRPAPDDKTSIMARIAEAREAQRATPERRDPPLPDKKKFEPDL